MLPQIKTSVLIVSDTHGMDFGNPIGLGNVDVAIHCGDLTDGSKLEEFRRTIKRLDQIQAPLKLAIAGNHDFTMDISAFEKIASEAIPRLDPELVAKKYGISGKVQALFEDAKDLGVVLLSEGNHQFKLANGALLRVYASPYTPGRGGWGFQYHPQQGHDFSIAKETDIVITHGPPKGIMDYTDARERAGCPHLFTAVAQVKPQIHCFGHIHEAWGARQVTWRETHGFVPTHFNAIDNNNSRMLETLSTLKPSKFDDSDDLIEKHKRLEMYNRDGCVKVDLSSMDDIHQRSTQTLFVNASMTDMLGKISQLPWIVYVDLSAAIKNADS